MSEENKSAIVIIPPEHQSAPAEHWADKEILKAAEEIAEGKFTPKLGEDDFFYYGPEQLIAMHPRVQEAMERLKTEVRESRNSQEFIEKSQMLHEINENLSKPEMWDGQGRWMGKENEEMRYGELLDPHEFMRRLCGVIGEHRVELNRFAVMGRVALLVRDPDSEIQRALALPSIDYDYEVRQAERSGGNFKWKLRKLEASFAAAEDAEYVPPEFLKGKKQVATLQWPVGTEWMVMRINEYGVPTSPKYLGWRTALLSLIFLDIITEEEAHRAFPVKANAASLWYRAQLYHRRNGGRTDG